MVRGGHSQGLSWDDSYAHQPSLTDSSLSILLKKDKYKQKHSLPFCIFMFCTFLFGSDEENV